MELVRQNEQRVQQGEELVQQNEEPVQNSATTFKELFAIAKRLNNKEVMRQLEKSKRAQIAKYLRKAVLSSRTMRLGGLKASMRSKLAVVMLSDDTRTCSQLLEEHDCASDRGKAVSDAKKQDEAAEITSGKNFEILANLCRALLKDKFDVSYDHVIKRTIKSSVADMKLPKATKPFICDKCHILTEMGFD